MFELHRDSYAPEVPHPLDAQSIDPTAPTDTEWANDLAAAYLLRQLQTGEAQLRIATSLLARRGPDLDLALAHIGATRRTLDLVGYYLTNVDLNCDDARNVVSAHNRLSKQHRETLKRLHGAGKLQRRLVPAFGDYPALV